MPARRDARGARPLSARAGFQEVQVVVLGCGAIGLPLAIAFAEQGFEILGIDTDRQRVATLSEASVEDRDAGIATSLKKVVAEGRIRFARSPSSASRRRAFIVTVPTPVDAANQPVLSNVEDAFRTSVTHAHDGDLIIVRSTVPIGTTRRLALAALNDRPGLLFAACVDRSLAGRGLADQRLVPNVIGGMDPSATDSTAALFNHLGPVVRVSSPEAAEAVKLFCNVQRDAIFALANQFALISEALGLDAGEIFAAASEGYPRFLPTRPGPVGGPCLSKDSHLLAHSLGSDDRLAGLALAARQVNHSLLDHAATAVAGFLPKAANHAVVISVLGLAFKGNPETIDRRGSFGSALVERLRRDLTAEIRAIDPASERLDMPTLERVAGGADIVVFANDHAAIGGLDLGDLAAIMRPNGTIYDLCGINRPKGAALPHGIRYRAFGDGSIHRDLL
jgi:UDP-N-acetyl-D-mannosaminuronic acid dehydrogenase